MRKIDEVLERLKKIEYYFNEDEIRDLMAKNAVLERDKELLIAALISKGDTDIIVYNGKYYRVCNKTLNESVGECETLDVNCVLIEK